VYPVAVLLFVLVAVLLGATLPAQDDKEKPA
jgi:hypothetical protein